MRDSRGRSPSPRRIGRAVGSFRESIEPATPLAAMETVWDEAVGAGIAAVTSPVSERDGVLTVNCESAVWAEELAMMEPQIRARIHAAAPESGLRQIRFRTA